MCVFSAPAQRITPNVPITSTPEIHYKNPQEILKKTKNPLRMLFEQLTNIFWCRVWILFTPNVPITSTFQKTNFSLKNKVIIQK